MQRSAGPKGNICGGQCCSPDSELLLRKQGQEVFADMLRHKSRTLQGLLNSTATSLQEHILAMTSRSENKTAELFLKLFQGHSVHATDTINALYTDIRQYVLINSSQDAYENSNTAISTSVSRFFANIFPLMYHRIGGTPDKDFTVEYKNCLKETMGKIKPFGTIPTQVAESLSKALAAARLLLQALGVGVEVLNATDTLIIAENGRGNAECHDALMRMSYCPKCMGLKEETKPCSGYCMNVMRGCLTKYVVDLDAPWNGYVEGIERLVTAMKQHNNEAGVNVDTLIKELDNRISEAIIYAMENEKDIDVKVKRACGVVQLSDREDPSMIPTEIEEKTSMLPAKQYSSSSENLMLNFLNYIVKSRGFYSALADNLCQDESFAERKDEHCWNGERIGGYTKTIADPSLDTQKYNPEVKPSLMLQNTDPRAGLLAEKLRHVHTMVMSSLGAVSMPESFSYVQGMQGDATDGSGSGAGPDITDDENDRVEHGSGAGSGSVPPVFTETNQIDGETKTASSTTHLPSTLLTTVLVLLAMKFL